jgi:hypothetical protein
LNDADRVEYLLCLWFVFLPSGSEAREEMNFCFYQAMMLDETKPWLTYPWFSADKNKRFIDRVIGEI